MRRFLLVAPLVVFAATLALLQWVGGMPVTRLWLHTLLVGAAVAALVRLIPWNRWLFRLRPRSSLYEASLFVLFVRHFAWLFLHEARRLLIAWRLATPFRFRPGWYRALTFVVAAFFSRVLVRTERFYASMLLRSSRR